MARDRPGPGDPEARGAGPGPEEVPMVFIASENADPEPEDGFIAPEMVPWLSEKSEDQSGGPRTNLEVFGDEVSFQYFWKT